MYGNITTIAQISVINTKNISSVASGRLRNPNCIGVKARLKTMFRINGNATINGIFKSCDDGKKVRIKTPPKAMIIMAYNTVHTGPNIHDGGAHDGFSNSE